jgi:hypothetical protein
MTTPVRPGWYPDPSGKRGKSYWDGHSWHASGESITAFLIKTFVMVFVLPYIVFGLIFAWVVAQTYPQAVAIITAVLVIVLVAALLGFLHMRRKFEHFLIARRADKQNAAYLRGKERGIYGKFRPEDLGDNRQ